ncbi:hypothetical protein GCM10010987_67690 [Bradyrhizobium guangdongense]|uniref:Uncharacterized protein n=1 Tax=Bradyrhizobium guangdongense TaxID=1325090 RepID=A0AA87WA40_9BRAD|nr:hypothetical protein GCM10010987_67690 [Bradyrhizobium guangdongense]
MVGIDVEDPIEQRRAVGGTVADESRNGGQMQRRHMIRLCLQELRAEDLRLIRPTRRKILRRLPYDPIYCRIAQDSAPLFNVRDAG